MIKPYSFNSKLSPFLSPTLDGHFDLAVCCYKVVPPSSKLVISPVTIDISPTKTIVIGVMFTNLAIERGHHLV
jgi:hypothetical protein